MINAIKRILPNPYLRFVIFFITLYFVFYYSNEFYIGITAKGGLYSAFLDENLNYIKWWRKFYLETSASILRLLNYTVLTNQTDLMVVGKGGIRLIYSCLGYSIMSAFAAFCLTFPNPFKHRFGFLIGGLILIQLMNILRFVLLSLYWDRRHPLFGMDHHDLFNIIVYLSLIALTYVWIKYISKQA